ncbi:hypothetical protein HPQ64_13095 [Rhizobiales bacterium]|uniref:hypothetical protein n=1 Tax=Hongsoonwoonella zoysiae TaxID=2821844 RepID=UPI001560B1BE|nr:hypothetical protein [Hongsoonwoonella zoysiae]NRG18627.1 hypothetical protein [Hongsoonwoonella zoysiae]
MTSRRAGSPLDFDSKALLACLGNARSELIAARRGMKPRSGLARCVDALIDDIDELALVMTGQREYFHAGGHARLSGKASASE